MSIESQPFKLGISQFLSRFRNSKKLDDIFSRGYTICNDSLTNSRVILKFYAIETADQEQAVLENLMNFAKLNQIQGICKLIAYAIAESGTQLISAFEYDPITLGEYVKAVKDSGITRPQRQFMYIQLIREVLRVIVTGVQIGIELDDINRETVLIKQSPLLTNPSSSSSISPPLSHTINIFYDEREKQYTRLQSTELSSLSPPSSSSLSPSSSMSAPNNNNKIYWSLQKIENQILKNCEYSTQQGQESVYQLGLMMLDIVYEVEKQYQSFGTQSMRDEEELKPDQIAIHTENVLSYYQIDAAHKKVQRNQMLISHRLNYLNNINNEINKELCILIKNMIILIPQTRISINKLSSQLERISQLQKYLVSTGKADTPLRGLQKNTQSLRSIESCQEEVVHFPSTETLKNVEQVPKYPSNDNIDSLKYSQNSIGNGYDTFKFSSSSSHPNGQNIYNSQESPSVQIGNSSSSFQVQKQLRHPQSATTITSDNTNSTNFKKMTSGFTTNEITVNGMNSRIGSGFSREENSPNPNTIQNQNQVNLSQDIRGEEIIGFWKGTHEDLKSQLRKTIAQIQRIKRSNPNGVIKKQYIDKSLYYGCINSSSKREGLGIYIYKTGDIYFGIWKQNSLTNGTYLFKNGQSFQGLVKSGKQGHGIYRYSNGNIYDGEWKDDLKNGNGSMKYPSGAKYEGEWMKGKKHGNGIYYYQNGIQYNGGFALGKKYGNGIFTFPGGTRVEGFWDNNHLQGLCRIFYKNGDYYEGNVHMSEKSGEGLYQWNSSEQNEVQYRGEFNKDNLDGFAIVKFKNRQVYEGRIKNGKRDGQGIYRYNNGDEFHGQWKNDDKKIGKYVFGNGDVFEGNFKNGQMAFGVMKYQNGQIYEGDFQRGERHGVGTYSNKIGQLVYEGKWERDQYIGPNKNEH